jgi:hypothetical protein
MSLMMTWMTRQYIRYLKVFLKTDTVIIRQKNILSTVELNEMKNNLGLTI